MNTRRAPLFWILRLLHRITNGYQGRPPNPAGRSSRRQLPRPVRASVAAVAAVSLMLTLTAQSGADGGGSTTKADKNKPANVAASTQQVIDNLLAHKYKPGTKVKVAVGITAVVAEGGLITLTALSKASMDEALLAFVQIHVDVVKFVWQIGTRTVTFAVRAGAIVRTRVVQAGKVLAGLKPLAIPITLLMAIAYQQLTKRSQIADIGWLARDYPPSGDVCRIKYHSVDGRTITRIVSINHQGCASPKERGTSSVPTGYILYGDPNDEITDRSKVFADFTFTRKLTVTDYSDDPINLGKGVKGRSCTVKFTGGVKLKLRSDIVDPDAKPATVSDPCGVYFGQQGKVMYAGKAKMGVEIGRRDQRPSNWLLGDATVAGSMTVGDQTGLGCVLKIDHSTDRGLGSINKDKGGSYSVRVAKSAEAIGVCVRDGFVRARYHWGTLTVCVQTSRVDAVPVEANCYDLHRRDIA